jgi:hypothetical protein
LSLAMTPTRGSQHQTAIPGESPVRVELTGSASPRRMTGICA